MIGCIQLIYLIFIEINFLNTTCRENIIVTNKKPKPTIDFN